VILLLPAGALPPLCIYKNNQFFIPPVTFCPATKSNQKTPILYVLFRRLFGNGRHAIACALHDKARLLFLKMPRLTQLKAKRIALKNLGKHLILLNKKRLSAK
jgi:hypothetical protein